MNRRHMLKNGTIAAAAALVPGVAALAAPSPQSVIAGLSIYSGRVQRVTEGAEVHLVASIDNMGAFVDAESRRQALPYEAIEADGNVLTFTFRGTAYRIENVLPSDFAARVRALS